MRPRSLLFVPVLLFLTAALPAETLRVGLAVGFPPYQSMKDGRPEGLDVALTRALAQEAGFTVEWVPRPWDELLALLRLSHDLDAVAGMEQTGDRPRLYLLGKAQYFRRNMLVVRADGPPIRNLEDLADRAVAGDRGAFGEQILADRGLKADVRLVRTRSKDESFNALVTGRVAAALMPELVALALAKEHGVAVRLVDLGDPGSPVGLAFPKDRADLAVRLDLALGRLEKSGALRKLLASFRP